MQPLNFEEVLERMTGQDTRYSRDAYLFLREALDSTQKQLGPRSEPRHVTGQELIEGARKHALGQYGPMAKTVLNEWGIQSCEDFGELVFRMIEFGLLSKNERDSRSDFQGGFDFDTAFCKPFRPRATAPTPMPETQADQP